MKGRFLFFLIGLLPFLFPDSSFGQFFVFYERYPNPITGHSYPDTWSISSEEKIIGSSGSVGPKFLFNIYVYKNTDFKCTNFQIISSISSYYGDPGPGIEVQSLDDISNILNNQTCGSICPDTDGDGLCDQCDEYPNDSEIGKEVWMKGLYQYDGKTVATKTSPTNKNKNFDTTQLIQNESGTYNRNFPGYKLDGFGAGGAISIDNDEFVKGGGKIFFADDPYVITEITCPEVENIDQCQQIECVRKPRKHLGNTAEDTMGLKSVDSETPYFDIDPKNQDAKAQSTPEDISQTEPYYKPIAKSDPNDPVSTDPCPEHRALCTNTCGGSRKVSRFACEGTGGKSHVVCECDSKGGYEYAPSFNDIGDDKFTTATSDGDKSTTSNFGSGTGKGYDPDSVGSGTDDLNQDGDPTNDSYSYEEGQVDFSPVQAAYGRLTGKFPFNLANSFVDFFRPFANAQGSTPTFTYEVVGHVVRFDLSPFNDFARFIRSMFALGLTLSTILALLYIYVGIDFRRK
ncbi:MAG: hypothetical protein Q4G66_00950 [bacterium]|nr:hypothetical protein [bacterium]